MKIREITNDVYWIGALDPDLRIFDVIMETKWGTTYNSYLIKGNDKIAVVEMVKNGFGASHIDKVKELVDPKEIDYIIVNHTEPDHSGALEQFLTETVNATVVSSKAAYNFLKEIANRDFPHIIAKDGDSIDLGGKTLKFISAPYLHWPDSMFTYLEEDKILFPCDAFGCHYAPDAQHIFNDEMDKNIVDAQKYYFDVIMSPFKKYMLDAIDKIRPLDINMVCPGHGPILREKPWDTINRNYEWSKDVLNENQPKKIFVGFVSAYGNTKHLGEAIIQGIKEAGDFDIEMIDISKSALTEVTEKIDKADAILLGSPTINRDALEPVWRVLSHTSAYKNKGKQGAAFGTYGWSGEAVGMIEERLKSLQFNVVSPGYRTKLVPSPKALEEAKEFGKNFANTLSK